jgi:predicted ester cyclase
VEDFAWHVRHLVCRVPAERSELLPDRAAAQSDVWVERPHPHLERCAAQAYTNASEGEVSAVTIRAGFRTRKREDPMSAHDNLEQNKDIIRRFNEAVFNGHDVDAVERFISPECHNHVTGGTGVEDFKNVARLILRLAPDAHSTIDDLVAEGDRVVIFITFSGTQQGALPAWNLPPSGKPFSVRAVHSYRVKNGMIVEHSAVRDDLSMLQQLSGKPLQQLGDMVAPEQA